MFGSPSKICPIFLFLFFPTPSRVTNYIQVTPKSWVWLSSTYWVKKQSYWAFYWPIPKMGDKLTNRTWHFTRNFHAGPQLEKINHKMHTYNNETIKSLREWGLFKQFHDLLNCASSWSNGWGWMWALGSPQSPVSRL